jgi:hypothetical protein
VRTAATDRHQPVSHLELIAVVQMSGMRLAYPSNHCLTTNEVKSTAFPGDPPNVVVRLALPEAELAVPALHVALVGAPVAPCPRLVMVAVAPARVLAAAKVRVAVAVLPRLKLVRRTVCPMAPATLQPREEWIEANPVGP